MHIGYALIAAGALVRFGNTRIARLTGVVYPLLVLLVIVATGNHFFFDAATGAIVVVAAYLAAVAIGKSDAGAVTETSDRAALCRLPDLATAQRASEEELAA
jgi:PAP2 superfamily